MKNLLFLFAFAFFPATLFSQVYVDKYDINADEKVNYCTVYVSFRLKQEAIVTFDYGQKIKRNRSTRVFGSDKIEVFFYSVTGVMNFMTTNGWELYDGPLIMSDGQFERCVFKKEEK